MHSHAYHNIIFDYCMRHDCCSKKDIYPIPDGDIWRDDNARMDIVGRFIAQITSHRKELNTQLIVTKRTINSFDFISILQGVKHTDWAQNRYTSHFLSFTFRIIIKETYDVDSCLLQISQVNFTVGSSSNYDTFHCFYVY